MRRIAVTLTMRRLFKFYFYHANCNLEVLVANDLFDEAKWAAAHLA
jgi:hypothetical protein